MRYPIAIEPDADGAAFGVVVPDLCGCFSAGDTLDDALANVEKAIAAWLDATRDAGGAVPAATRLDAIRANPACLGWILSYIGVNPEVAGSC